MPPPSVWGPLAWTLLHGIGHRAGTCTNKKLQADERREVYWLLQHLEYIIPCAECRQHIKLYRKQAKQANTIGEWIWTFHEAVNKRVQKPPGPPFTPELGKNVEVWKQWLAYLECVKESFQIGHLHQVEVKEWNRHLRHWLACF